MPVERHYRWLSAVIGSVERRDFMPLSRRRGDARLPTIRIPIPATRWRVVRHFDGTGYFVDDNVLERNRQRSTADGTAAASGRAQQSAQLPQYRHDLGIQRPTRHTDFASRAFHQALDRGYCCVYRQHRLFHAAICHRCRATQQLLPIARAGNRQCSCLMGIRLASDCCSAASMVCSGTCSRLASNCSCGCIFSGFSGRNTSK